MAPAGVALTVLVAMLCQVRSDAAAGLVIDVASCLQNRSQRDFAL